MDEFTTTRQVEVDPSRSITWYLLHHATTTPDAALYRRQIGDEWTDVSAAETLAQVRALVKGLRAAGFAPGERIAIMGRTSYEWTIADLAIWHLGAVPVPVYETSSTAQAQWILSDAGVSGVFCETRDHERVIEEARAEDSGHAVRATWVFERGDLESLVAAGRERDDDEADAGYRELTLASPATIIYTSGTTGRPKGVELTHGNFVELSEEALAKLAVIFAKGDADTLLFIPLAHVFARFIEVLALVKGIPLGHCPDAKSAVADIATFRPTLLLSVPRVWEKVYNGAELKQGGGAKLKIFRWAARVSIAYSRALQTPAGPSFALRAQHALADRLVYAKIRALLGGRLEWTISGGAPLGERLGNFYQGIGLNMLEGYGLTETAAPTHVNLPFKARMGTVGPPLPGTSVRIADDGEILVKGIGVFAGYHDNAEATAEAIVGGWFHTGDVGSMDEQGYLSISGRKKELIITAGGKNVAPAQLEDPLRAHPLISQVVVVGDQRPFISALITLDAEVLPRWLETHSLPAMDVEEATTNATVRDHIQMAVDRVNARVSRAESIREIRLLSEDFTEENGLLTPSIKVKRAAVIDRYADVIADIYSGAAPAAG